MPSGTKTGIGIGVGQGVTNFINAYYQGKAFEEEEKRNKYAPILQMILSQVQDDDIPFNQRAELIDSVPDLLGIKLPTRLSKQLGLDKMNQMMVDTGQKSEEQLPSIDINHYLNKEGEVQSQSEVIQEGRLSEPILKKRGELTPRELKSIYNQRELELKNKAELAQQKELIKLRNEADIEELKTKGFKELGNFFDKDKNRWFTAFGNPITGDEKRLYYPENATPEKVITKQISGGGLTGKYKMLAQAEEDVSNYEKNGDKSGVSTGRYLAAKRVLDADTSGQDVREALTSYYSTRNEGDLPIQPAQKESIDLQKKTADRLEANSARDLEIKITEADADIQRYSLEANSALQNLVRLEQLYNGIKRDKNAEPEEIERAKDDYTRANSAYSEANGRLEAAHTRKSRLESLRNSSQTPASNVTNPNNRKLLDDFRRLNPNVNWTDEEILEFLRKKKNSRR
jgi:hypothetical protein